MEILLTGATGHVGGRLLPELAARGHGVRALSRRPERLHDRVGGRTRAVEGDVNDRDALLAALDGVEATYYLVHSLDSASFADTDRRAAETFAAAARDAGVARIVYLGGLGKDEDGLSEHLSSRQEVGEILRGAGVDAIELRASIVLGAGSLSFELLRTVVESLPVVPMPDWATTDSQPIATDDVVQYLADAVELQVDASRVYEIGGADRLPYLDLMETYADMRGLRRMFVPLPVPVPSLVSPTRAPGEWLMSFAPERARAAAALLESLRYATAVEDDAALRDFEVRPRGVREALEAALAETA